jgi:hypothetical protein
MSGESCERNIQGSAQPEIAERTRDQTRSKPLNPRAA